MKKCQSAICTFFFCLGFGLTTLQAQQLTIAKGTQQPIEIVTVTATKEAKSITLQGNVHAPSATNNGIVLKTNSDEMDDLMYLLQDTNGRVVLSNKIESDETDIAMTNLAPAAYFLTVSNEQVSKTFKIIKY